MATNPKTIGTSSADRLLANVDAVNNHGSAIDVCAKTEGMRMRMHIRTHESLRERCAKLKSDP